MGVATEKKNQEILKIQKIKKKPKIKSLADKNNGNYHDFHCDKFSEE